MEENNKMVANGNLNGNSNETSSEDVKVEIVNDVTANPVDEVVNGETQICLADVAGAPDHSEGHYLVANTDINAGDVVLSDYPLVSGPLYTRSKPVCLQCLKKLTGQATIVNCERCKAPLCSTSCMNGKWHAMECKVLESAGYEITIENWEADCPIYSCITVLRGLLVQQLNNEQSRILDSFMDHDKERAVKDSPTWKIHEKLVFSFIAGSLQLKHITQAAVRRMIGVIRTNAVKLETRAGHGEGVAVYPTYTYANHNCLCNTHTRKHKDLKLQLIAHSDIKKGETIWTRYTTPQIGNFQRVSDIQKTWHFTCTCDRCTDPTEFGTMMSGLICGPECPGILLPIKSTFVGSPWSCTECKRKLGVLAIQKITKEVIDRIGDKRHSSNQELINLIDELSGTVLHKNHYLLIGIKEILLQRMIIIIGSNIIFNKHSNEDKVTFLELRTRLFTEIVQVLAKVDSPGAPWSQKLEKMKKEEASKIADLKL